MAADLNTSGRVLIPLGTTARRALDLAALRGDLAGLWRQEGRGIVRACHATLVVCVPATPAHEALLEDLVRARPSRVILLEPDPSLPAGEIEAWASGSCYRRPGGDALVCSETIHLRAGPGADPRIASVVRSLTVGGLPLEVLVLDGSPLAITWLARLGDEVDRVLFQSALLEVGECLALWKRWSRATEPPRFHDLTWSALEGWRGVVASRFDGGEAVRLRTLRRVTLTLDGPAHRSAEALLFAGWLGSRLGWMNVRKGPGSVTGAGSVSGKASAWLASNPDGLDVSLLVRGGTGTTANHGLREVEFGFEGAWPDRTWRWNRSEGAWHVEDRGVASPGRTVPALPETASSPILRALRSSGRNAAPVEAMRLATQLGEVWFG